MCGGIDVNNIDLYIEQTLKRIECTSEERNDLRQELETHLQEAAADYMKEGYSKDEAEQLAIANFGDHAIIGEQLQQTMHPYRKGMMLFIGLSTILYGVLIYLHVTINYGHAPFILLTSFVFLGTAITLFSMNPAFIAERKVMLNISFALSVIFLIFTLMMLETSSEFYVSGLWYFGGLLVLLTFIMIFQTALKQSSYTNVSKKQKRIKQWLHVYNLIVGILIFGYSLIFTWAFLAFGDGVSFFFLLVPFTIISLWGLSYWLQFKLYEKKPILMILFALINGGISLKIILIILGIPFA